MFKNVKIAVRKQHSQEIVDKMNETHKPTLQELSFPSEFGPCPGESYKLSTLHGWYKESESMPRC